VDKALELLQQLLTVDQWRAFIWIVITTSAITETVKRVFLLRASAFRRKRAVYASAFVTGNVAGFVGWAMVGTETVPAYYWVIFGAIAGPLANFLHWVTLGVVAWKFPALAEALKGKK